MLLVWIFFSPLRLPEAVSSRGLGAISRGFAVLIIYNVVKSPINQTQLQELLTNFTWTSSRSQNLSLQGHGAWCLIHTMETGQISDSQVSSPKVLI